MSELKGNSGASVAIPIEVYNKLAYLGILPSLDDSVEDTREYNIGASDYSKGDHVIQPWSIWLDYPALTSFDHDIIKRILRTKATDSRQLDYEKIIHICKERIRQLSYETDKTFI